jgi:hypothetical protein
MILTTGSVAKDGPFGVVEPGVERNEIHDVSGVSLVLTFSLGKLPRRQPHTSTMARSLRGLPYSQPPVSGFLASRKGGLRQPHPSIQHIPIKRVGETVP